MSERRKYRYGAIVVAAELMPDGSYQATIGWPGTVPLTIGQTIVFDLHPPETEQLLSGGSGGPT
jgi:hypothetical protein